MRMVLMPEAGRGWDFSNLGLPVCGDSCPAAFDLDFDRDFEF